MIDNFFLKNETINNHIDKIIKYGKIESYYSKYKNALIFNAFFKESVFWTIIYLNERLKQSQDDIKKYVGIIIMMYALTIPVGLYTIHSKHTFIKKFITKHNLYYKNKLEKVDKKVLLNFNFSGYFENLLVSRTDFDLFFNNEKYKIEIIVKIINLFVYALLNKRFSVLTFSLVIVFLIIANNVQENNYKETEFPTEDNHDKEETLKKYMSNSKLFIINGELNHDYIHDIYDKMEENTDTINNSNLDADMKLAVLIFLIVITIIGTKLNDMKVGDFLIFMYIIYDFETLVDSITNYYTGTKRYKDLETKIKYLDDCDKHILPEHMPSDLESDMQLSNEKYEEEPINQIVIRKLISETPKLVIENETVIRKGEQILIDGESGAGKTSLFYILKGVLKPTEIDIEPSLEYINKKSYININSKDLYSGNIYDIITNYDNNPDVNLIKTAVETACLHNLDISSNKYKNIEELSAGEQSRLLLARNIYIILKGGSKYDVILLDEVDKNLNDSLALQICSNIKHVFRNKIVFYITHNNIVKKEFSNNIKILKD